MLFCQCCHSYCTFVKTIMGCCSEKVGLLAIQTLLTQFNCNQLCGVEVTVFSLESGRLWFHLKQISSKFLPRCTGLPRKTQLLYPHQDNFTCRTGYLPTCRCILMHLQHTTSVVVVCCRCFLCEKGLSYLN